MILLISSLITLVILNLALAGCALAQLVHAYRRDQRNAEATLSGLIDWSRQFGPL